MIVAWQIFRCTLAKMQSGIKCHPCRLMGKSVIWIFDKTVTKYLIGFLVHQLHIALPGKA